MQRSTVRYCRIIVAVSTAIGCSAIVAGQPGPASAADEASRCAGFIRETVPTLNCSDGALVPKEIDGMGYCREPEGLNNRCVYRSRLGRVELDPGKKIDIVYSCRKDFSSDHADDSTDKYYDIAAIAYDRETGATCFYQHLGNASGENIPAPGTAGGAAFWKDGVDYCSPATPTGR